MQEARTMPLKLNDTPEVYLSYQLFPKIKSLKIEDKGRMVIVCNVTSERTIENGDGESKLIKTFKIMSAKPKRKNVRMI